MCFGINKCGQIVDVGLTGQYDYRLNRYQPNLSVMFPFNTKSQALNQSSFPSINNTQFGSAKTTYWDMMSKLLEYMKNQDFLLPAQKTGWGGIYE